MTLTPLDIEKKEFRRAFRGYSEKDVDDFLDIVIKDFETMYRENIDLKEKVEHLQDQLEQYRRLEETLKNTLVLAQQTAEEAKSNAHREVELILKESREKANRLLAEAQEEVQVKLQQLQQTRQDLKIFHSKVKSLLDAQIRLLTEMEEELTQ